MMTDFQQWLDAVELEDHEEIYHLYRAVKNASPYGLFDVKRANGADERWIVSVPYMSESLLVASEAARETFIRLLVKNYCPSDLDMEAWYSYKQALSKND